MLLSRLIRGVPVCAALAIAIHASSAASAAAQELPLRRDIPDPTPFSCTALPTPVRLSDSSSPSDEDREEAARLSADATNASILGDHQAARDRLARAAALDPADAGIAFRLARALQELGDPAWAAREYCRYLRLASNPPDAYDVRELIEQIAPPHRVGIPDSAVDRFIVALEFADQGRLAQADSAFTQVIDAAPSWAAPLHNRGVLRALARRRDAARADFAYALDIEPDGPSENVLRDWIRQLDSPRNRYSVGGAMAAGLLPGVGHFYTGRPSGVLYLAGAGGAAAAGFMIQTKNIECLTIPQDNVCPPGQIRREWVERPYLVAGIGAAAAITVLGAIDAARGASRRNAVAPIIDFAANGSGDGPRLVMPDVRANGSRLDVALFRIEFQD